MRPEATIGVESKTISVKHRRKLKNGEEKVYSYNYTTYRLPEPNKSRMPIAEIEKVVCGWFNMPVDVIRSCSEFARDRRVRYVYMAVLVSQGYIIKEAAAEYFIGLSTMSEMINKARVLYPMEIASIKKMLNKV